MDWATFTIGENSVPFTIGSTPNGNKVKRAHFSITSPSILNEVKFYPLTADISHVLRIDGWLRIGKTNDYVPLNYSNPLAEGGAFVWSYIRSTPNNVQLGLGTNIVDALESEVSVSIEYVSNEYF